MKYRYFQRNIYQVVPCSPARNMKQKKFHIASWIQLVLSCSLGLRLSCQCNIRHYYLLLVFTVDKYGTFMQFLNATWFIKNVSRLSFLSVAIQVLELIPVLFTVMMCIRYNKGLFFSELIHHHRERAHAYNKYQSHAVSFPIWSTSASENIRRPFYKFC